MSTMTRMLLQYQRELWQVQRAMFCSTGAAAAVVYALYGVGHVFVICIDVHMFMYTVVSMYHTNTHTTLLGRRMKVNLAVSLLILAQL